MIGSPWFWITLAIFMVLCGASSVLVFLWPRIRGRRAGTTLQHARQNFHRRREWLEAKFLSLAAQSGKPRGMKWVDCDFADDVAFARDRKTGRYRALVAVAIQFEAIPGGGMEEVEAVAQRKAATVVFRLDGPEWEVDGRALFNLNPAQTIAQFQHELEMVE